MWGALPLARRALHAALLGRRPLLAAAPAEEDLAAESVKAVLPTIDVSMTELAPWAERARTQLTARGHAR
jgi:hypothetical protein